MALFPRCTFQLHASHGVVVAGRRFDGILVLVAPEPIPRAERVEIVFRTRAWAGYGSGKSRSVVQRDVFYAPLEVKLPVGEPLPAGEHRYPFAIDVPPWLPPAYQGNDCAIEHSIDARLDVDWAIDPKVKLVPVVMPGPQEGRRAPLVLRSPNGFHEHIVLEVALASAVIPHGEPLEGHIALRGGHDARFDAVELSLASMATMTMARREQRRGAHADMRIAAATLRAGQAVPFMFPPDPAIAPSFRNSFIDHDVILAIKVDIPWGFDPSFSIPVYLLPRGSQLTGDNAVIPVGTERLRLLASAVAARTGFEEAQAPTLVKGALGPVEIAITDSPRSGRIGVDVDVTFPDVELGIVFRPIGVLDGFRDTKLVPAALRGRYFVRCRPDEGRPDIPEAASAAFLGSALDGLDGAQEVRLTDHHLGAHCELKDDGEALVRLALFFKARAQAIGEAIAALPFPEPVAAAATAWRATAAARNAWLVPSGPALHGLRFRARVRGGDERVLVANVRTVWTKEGPTTEVAVDLAGVGALPAAARAELESDAPGARLRVVRNVFPETRPDGDAGVSLVRPEFTADPRSLLAAIEELLDFALDARGEKRSDSAYR